MQPSVGRILHQFFVRALPRELSNAFRFTLLASSVHEPPVHSRTRQEKAQRAQIMVKKASTTAALSCTYIYAPHTAAPARTSKEVDWPEDRVNEKGGDEVEHRSNEESRESLRAPKW